MGRSYKRITGKKFASVALAALGTLLFTACLALSAFARLSTDGKVYYNIQMDEAVDAGIEPDEMLELDIMLAEYLAGDESALDETEAFHQREKAHMVDVFVIFEAVRLIRSICFFAGSVFLAGAVVLREKCAAWGALIGAGMFFLPLIAIGIWAAADFSAAFTAMHHLLFSNDLWLMDPRTDLMIRMLPQRFFVRIAAYIGCGTGIAALCAPVICFLGLRGAAKFLNK